MAYEIVTRRFLHSAWVFGEDSFLSEGMGRGGIDGAEWIWPHTYARAYLRRYFQADGKEPVSAVFLCDNPFDLFVNGRQVCSGVRHFEGSLDGYVTAGENRINLRAAQTADDGFFTSALCGVIRVGGRTIVTDGSWEAYVPVTFWENREPEDWQTMTADNRIRSCPIHPAANKRSLYLRGSFSVSGRVTGAILHTTSLGLAEMYLNGVRTDDELFSQGISEKYREYHTVDVTGLLREGRNVLGALTGNGWYNSASHSEVFMNKPKLRAELEIEYADGRRECFGTGRGWKCRFSPLTDNDLQFGERRDERLAIPDWCDPDYDDTDWSLCGTEEEIAAFVLRHGPPVVIKRRLEPVSRTVGEGRVLLDFGENCAGRYRIVLQNTEAGQRIRIRFCERLDRTGEPIVGAYTPVFFNRDAMPGGCSPACMRNFDLYICKGGEEDYEPHFAFSGFRYLIVEGLASPEQLVSARMTVMHNDLVDTGRLESGNPLIGQLFDATRRTWLSNALNGPMDCPTREKNYWTGDAQLFCPTACYLTDCSEFLARWTDGGRKMCPGVYGWGDEIYLIPYTLYQFYGDIGLLRVRWEEIAAYAEERLSCLEEGLPVHPNSPFNDHLSPFSVQAGRDFFACAYFCLMLHLLVKLAGLLGDDERRARYAALSKEADVSFDRRFYLPDLEKYTPEGQTGYVLPLAFGLVPAERAQRMAQKLNEAVLRRGCLDTGYVGTRYLMQVLCEYGYGGTAAMLLERREYPSWRHMLSQGGNTVCETWGGISDMAEEQSLSMNHFTLGSVVGWLFRDPAGIRWEESEAGFSHVVLKPVFLPKLGDLRATLQTVNGRITAGWREVGEGFLYEFSAERPITLILPDGSRTEYPAGAYRVEYHPKG